MVFKNLSKSTLDYQICLKSVNKLTNHPFKGLYVKIFTIGYYQGFSSSLKDSNEQMVVISNLRQRIRPKGGFTDENFIKNHLS